LFIQSKNPVIADCTDVKQNRQDAKNKCCTLLLTGIYSWDKQPMSIFGLFRRESVDFNLDAVVF